jgi:hypothetical protein
MSTAQRPTPPQPAPSTAAAGREPYQPPRLVELGTLHQLTHGHPPPIASDITFSGSGFH